jgi:outer membrane murein-binding lipoprotein Lpp
MNRRLFLSAALLGSLLLGGCLNVKTAPIEVKPIHITVDVNVKVAKALDDFFGDLDKKSATITPEEKK